MLDIIILTVGKLKEAHFIAASQEYLKRLKPYARVVVHELKPESFGSNDKERVKKAEGERISGFLEKYPDARVFVMDERGKEPTSVAFSETIDKAGGTMVFVIGGSLGLSKEILESNHKKISLSRMTMPHELARVVLLEQIYRAVTIAKGKKYHY